MIAIKSAPGNQRASRGHLLAGSMASGREIAVPYLTVDGSHDGPCLWINAAVHGDEINGVIVALEFFKAIEDLDFRGSVIVTPVANPLALDERRKSTLIDGIDMDQSFPGRADGFVTERIAHRLFGEFGQRASVIVNLHTLGTPYDAAPYAVYKEHPNVSEQQLLQMIQCFRPTVACRMPITNATGELPGNIAGALDYQGLAAGCPSFMMEFGGGGRLQPEIIKDGVDGFFRLANHLGMLGGALEPDQPSPTQIRRVTKRAHRMVEHGGLFQAVTAPGRVLPKGACLGQVRNVFGDIEERVTVDLESWVIAVRRDPVVHSGDRVAFLATEWDEVSVNRPGFARGRFV